jgi:hypothetical protein
MIRRQRMRRDYSVTRLVRDDASNETRFPAHMADAKDELSKALALCLTGSARWRYTTAHRKRWFKSPIHMHAAR